MSVRKLRLMRVLAPPCADIRTLLDVTNQSLTHVRIAKKTAEQSTRVKRHT